LIDHVGLEVTDLARAAAFYDAVLWRLGARRVVEGPGAIAYGRHEPRLWIVSRMRDGGPGAAHVALTAAGRPAVDAAHEAGLAAGGRDDGAPGPRPAYGPRYYAAYLLDPDGHRVEVVTGTG
jgi:catechol 2,3-dioxygenase-like lactoylglutathione lyase family enzyme